MELLTIIYFFLSLCLLVIGPLSILSVFLIFTTNPYKIMKRHKKEETFYDPISKSRILFPSINEPFTFNLSIVVPAYNEAERLPPMLKETIEFMEKRIQNHPTYKYEIIIVSDGSVDRTVKVAEEFVEKYGSDKIRCLELIENRGKGGAVQLGVQNARGATILFADADGASKFEDLVKLEMALKDIINCDPVTEPEHVCQKVALSIGSRAHLEKESLATRSVFRNILMYGFHFLVWLFTVRGIKDTQCGFKLFTRKAANICFQSLHVNRWAFDVELLYIAQKLNIPIAEISIRWTEIEGSKVTPVLSWIQMGCDLGLIWLKYTIGAWKIKDSKID